MISSSRSSDLEASLSNGLDELPTSAAEGDDGSDNDGEETLGLDEIGCEDGSCSKSLFRADRNDSLEMLEVVEEGLELLPRTGCRCAVEAVVTAAVRDAGWLSRGFSASLLVAMPSARADAL